MDVYFSLLFSISLDNNYFLSIIPDSVWHISDKILVNEVRLGNKNIVLVSLLRQLIIMQDLNVNNESAKKLKNIERRSKIIEI